MTTQKPINIIARQDQHHGYEYQVLHRDRIDEEDFYSEPVIKCVYWAHKKEWRGTRTYIYPGAEQRFVQAMNDLGYRVSLRKYRATPMQRAQSLLCREANKQHMTEIAAKRHANAQPA